MSVGILEDSVPWVEEEQDPTVRHVCLHQSVFAGDCRVKTGCNLRGYYAIFREDRWDKAENMGKLKQFCV